MPHSGTLSTKRVPVCCGNPTRKGKNRRTPEAYTTSGKSLLSTSVIPTSSLDQCRSQLTELLEGHASVYTHREQTTALCSTPHPGATVDMLQIPDPWFSMCSHPWALVLPLLHAWMHPWPWPCRSSPAHITNPQVSLLLCVCGIPHSRSVATPHISTYTESWPRGPSTTVSQPSVTTTTYQPYTSRWCHHCFVLSHPPNSSSVFPLYMLSHRQWRHHNLMCICAPELSPPYIYMWPRHRYQD